MSFGTTAPKTASSVSFLHQTTTVRLLVSSRIGCILFSSYIKPQQDGRATVGHDGCILFSSYIKPQQQRFNSAPDFCCILFSSYIKPQLLLQTCGRGHCCILFSSYDRYHLNLLISPKSFSSKSSPTMSALN